MKNEITKAGDLPKIEDTNHPVFWSEEVWIESWINENPDVLLKLELFKDLKIKKYEESLNGGWQEVN